MKKCKYCKTNKDLKQFTTNKKENYYVCIDCLHKEVRKAYLQTIKENEGEK